MSQENIEFMRAVYETWNSGDMDAFSELYDPDAIVRTPEGWPEPGPWVGREAIMREWEHIREAWNADVVELISDFIDAGDRVAVRHIWRVTAVHGPEVSMEITNVLMVRKGRIAYQEFFWDHAEALEALGLSEKDAHAGSS
jgi:ketosteroid isomerase-like protein